MNKDSKLLINLLSAAIRNRQPDVRPEETVNWDAVYEEAAAHQVHTLLFPVLLKLPPEYKPEERLMARWQKETALAAFEQIRHMEQIRDLLLLFHQEGIPVIVLKGLVLRNYYPCPELRTMGDADLLVRKKDMIKAKKLLKSYGYRLKENSARHSCFQCEDFSDIELHWLLNDRESGAELAEFTDQVWEHAPNARIGETPALVLSTDDQILHLILHTAHHFRSTGFGLRQLCDFVLFYEANAGNINTEQVLERAKLYQIHKFTGTLFLLCHKLFDLEIPGLQSDPAEDSLMELFLDDIIKSGVYGRRYPDRDTNSRILKYTGFDKSLQGFSLQGLSPQGFTLLHKWSHFLFPSPKKLNYRYSYAKKLPLLLPAAWLHRILHNLGKMKTLKQTDNFEGIRRDRSKLLQWLQLR